MIETIRNYMKMPPELLVSQINFLNDMVDDLLKASTTYDDFMKVSKPYRYLAFSADVAYSMVLPYDAVCADSSDITVVERLTLEEFKQAAVSLVLLDAKADYRYAYRSDEEGLVVTNLSVNPHGVALGFLRDDFPYVVRLASKD